jgi:hypothetical protein
MVLMFRNIALCLALLFCPYLTGQGLVEKVTDLMEIKLGPPPLDTNDFHTRIVVAPVVYYEPRTSFGFGVGGSLLFKPKGTGPETRTSNIPVGISYTLNNQIFFTSGYTIFFPEEKWLFRGNLDYSDFPQGYYGIGNFTKDEDRLEITFKEVLVEPLLLRQVKNGLFVGGGFRYDNFFATELIEATDELPKGFDLQDSLGSTSVGIELAISLDRRDNVVNASKGVFAEFTQGVYGEVLGGTNAFRLSKLDLRYYSQIHPKQVLAFNFFARFALGDAPVQELSSLGGETLLRGYQEDRFRDRLALFAQSEWRWQALSSIGVVGYAGLGRVGKGFDDLNPNGLYYSIGGGLRVLIIPSENINLRIDVAQGFGPVNDFGFYLGLGEAF